MQRLNLCADLQIIFKGCWLRKSVESACGVQPRGPSQMIFLKLKELGIDNSLVCAASFRKYLVNK